MTLPDNIVPVHKMGCHYSLNNKLREQQQLRGQVAAFKKWTHAPVQLDRAGGKLAGVSTQGPAPACLIRVWLAIFQLSTCVAERTWENLLNHIYLFLGFTHLYLGR